MLRELLHSKISVLRNIMRFSLWPRNYTETVAEHTMITIYMAREIAVYLMKGELEVNLLRVYEGATFHDTEESWTGDFPRTFREVPEIKEMIEKCIRFIAKAKMSPEQFELWDIHNGDDTEAQIIRFADWLAGLQYILRECRSGQTAILEKYEDQSDFIKGDLAEVKASSPVCAPLFDELDKIANELFTLFRKGESQDAK